MLNADECDAHLENEHVRVQVVRVDAHAHVAHRADRPRCVRVDDVHHEHVHAHDSWLHARACVNGAQ